MSQVVGHQVSQASLPTTLPAGIAAAQQGAVFSDTASMRAHLPSLWVDPKLNRNHLKTQQIAFSLIILPSQPQLGLFNLFGLNKQMKIETHRTRNGNDPNASPVDPSLTIYTHTRTHTFTTGTKDTNSGVIFSLLCTRTRAQL